LDDGYEARILSLQQVRAGLPLFHGFYSEAERLYPNAPEKLKFNEALRRLLDAMVSNLISSTVSRVQAVGVQTLADVRRSTQRLVTFSDTMEQERRRTRDFLYANLYYSPDLASEKEMAERIVGELFEYWIEHPDALPASYQAKTRQEPLPRVVCDYIAGMTDNYIFDQYAQMLKATPARI
jgi:dGTPase